MSEPITFLTASIVLMVALAQSVAKDLSVT